MLMSKIFNEMEDTEWLIVNYDYTIRIRSNASTN